MFHFFRSSFSCFKLILSDLIFEIILRRERAFSKASKIIHEVNEHNQNLPCSVCSSCGSFSLKEKSIGKRGFFSSRSIYFECQDCGHNQVNAVLGFRNFDLELTQAEIVFDGTYRYSLETVGFYFVFFMVVLCVGGVVYFLG